MNCMNLKLKLKVDAKYSGLKTAMLCFDGIYDDSLHFLLAVKTLFGCMTGLSFQEVCKIVVAITCCQDALLMWIRKV